MLCKKEISPNIFRLAHKDKLPYKGPKLYMLVSARSTAQKNERHSCKLFKQNQEWKNQVISVNIHDNQLLNLYDPNKQPDEH